jgi:hypothetical protein
MDCDDVEVCIVAVACSCRSGVVCIAQGYVGRRRQIEDRASAGERSTPAETVIVWLKSYAVHDEKKYSGCIGLLLGGG